MLYNINTNFEPDSFVDSLVLDVRATKLLSLTIYILLILKVPSLLF